MITHTHLLRSPRRGSVLLVAMMFSALIAIALTTYMKLAINAQNMAQRSFLANHAMNVTEVGLEQMLWSFNQANAHNSAAWAYWQQGATSHDLCRTFGYSGYFGSNQNIDASVNVYMQNYDSPGFPIPVGIAMATVTPANGTPIIKMVKVYLTRRSFFGTGMVGKRGVTFNGTNVTVDSWLSGVDTTPLSPTPYSAAVRRTNGSVAAFNLDATVAVGNANVYGYISVGSADAGGYVSLGPQGIVAGDFAATESDLTRISGNFTADLPNVTVPAPTAYTNITASGGTMDGGTFPRAAGNGAILDPVNPADGIYYYKASRIDLDSLHGKVPALTIRAGYKVAIILQNGTGGSGTEVVGTGNTSTLTVSTGAQFSIYTAGNVRLAGQGVTNQNGATTAFQVWGTATTAGGQRVQITGLAGLTGVVYAPNATVDSTGNGDVLGAIVGDTITMNGNGSFHYDESLANVGGSNPFKVVKWVELSSSSDRALYADLLDFNTN